VKVRIKSAIIHVPPDKATEHPETPKSESKPHVAPKKWYPFSKAMEEHLQYKIVGAYMNDTKSLKGTRFECETGLGWIHRPLVKWPVSILPLASDRNAKCEWMVNILTRDGKKKRSEKKAKVKAIYERISNDRSDIT
jgi:hypothetical protein